MAPADMQEWSCGRIKMGGSAAHQSGGITVGGMHTEETEITRCSCRGVADADDGRATVHRVCREGAGAMSACQQYGLGFRQRGFQFGAGAPGNFEDRCDDAVNAVPGEAGGEALAVSAGTGDENTHGTHMAFNLEFNRRASIAEKVGSRAFSEALAERAAEGCSVT